MKKIIIYSLLLIMVSCKKPIDVSFDIANQVIIFCPKDIDYMTFSITGPGCGSKIYYKNNNSNVVRLNKLGKQSYIVDSYNDIIKLNPNSVYEITVTHHGFGMILELNTDSSGKVYKTSNEYKGDCGSVSDMEK